MSRSRLKPLILILIAGACVHAHGVVPRQSMKAEPEKGTESRWSTDFSYGVSTDLADDLDPRLYYQGVTANLNRKLGLALVLSLGVAANFTTVDGQIDKRQEDSAADATGATPTLNLSYRPSERGPWFGGVSGSLLMDKASRLEGYVGLLSINGGAKWGFWRDRLVTIHTLAVSELMNTYEYSSSGSPNQATSVNYSWANAFNFSEHFALGATFSFKQTRYMDGFWDYSYATFLSASMTFNQWSTALGTTNGGHTDDGRVALWYVDRFRRIVSWSLCYSF
jgi:hypothetical protein